MRINAVLAVERTARRPLRIGAISGTREGFVDTLVTALPRILAPASDGEEPHQRANSSGGEP